MSCKLARCARVPAHHPSYLPPARLASYFVCLCPPFQLWHLARKVAGDSILDKAVAEKKSGGKALVLDVNQQGIFKVLGKGLMPELPIVVKARYVSKLAEEKIRAAGGAVILTA